MNDKKPGRPYAIEKQMLAAAKRGTKKNSRGGTTIDFLVHVRFDSTDRAKDLFTSAEFYDPSIVESLTTPYRPAGADVDDHFLSAFSKTVKYARRVFDK